MSNPTFDETQAIQRSFEPAENVSTEDRAKSLDKTSGDSSRSNQHPKPAFAGWILAAAGRLRVCVAAISTARARLCPATEDKAVDNDQWLSACLSECYND
jgi:hypothetical protein